MKIELPEINYDFRETANPEDKLKHLWDSWVNYYQTKAAIAKWLNPKSILEIGVRYGYSARAFLAGAPSAAYVGIDANIETYGGCHDGFTWARRILPDSAVLIEADTTGMKLLPGSVYDLIHIDGEQSGLSTYFDLERAAKQGRRILCDGYFWTSENFNAANDFLLRYKDVIEWSLVLPGYAGELLIHINEGYINSHVEALRGQSDSSDSLQSFYSADYFLGDCGGYESFNISNGTVISDDRLASIIDLLFARNPGKVLDLGCGRGEIAIQAAMAGNDVTAVDYSEKAIAIAKKAFSSIKNPKGRIEWICNSAINIELNGEYDTVICSDVIEHLSVREVDDLYALIARHLSRNGWFILHTFPNKWYYDYDYKRRQRIARSVGAHLPLEPRSRFEKLMHINEQRPQEMRRQLQKFFPHVCFWFGSPDNPQGSLVKNYSIHEMSSSRDLYAIATTEPLDTSTVVEAFSESRELSLEEAGAILVRILECPDRLERSSLVSIRGTIHNNTKSKISSRRPYPLNLSYHWLAVSDGLHETFDGIRTSIGTVYPGQEGQIQMSVQAPHKAGDYILQVRLVQENVRWLEGEGFKVVEQDRLIHIY